MSFARQSAESEAPGRRRSRQIMTAGRPLASARRRRNIPPIRPSRPETRTNLVISRNRRRPALSLPPLPADG